jgi:cytochrome c-type biogenesis protein
MKSKPLWTAILLCLVAGGLVQIAARRLIQRRADAGVAPMVDGVVVYCFHGAERCRDCRNIEEFGREAIHTGFARQLAEGQVQWRAVDYDVPRNRHFDEKYRLGAIPSLVFVEFRGGVETRYDNLDEVWDLVLSGDKPRFVRYVQDQLQAFLQDAGREEQAAAAPAAWSYLASLGWALWLGIFTSINPCPLATNIAAVAYIGRRVGSPRAVAATGLLYALGRTLAYLALGVALASSLLASGAVRSFLHEYAVELMGPILIVVAMFLLGMLRTGAGTRGVSGKWKERVDALGVWGALPLGILFALAFCPTSAALFFGMLIPGAALCDSPVAMPALYGVGTALPVLFFAAVMVFSAKSLGRVFGRLGQIEWWVRRITALVLLALGIYFTLAHVFGIAISR